MTRRLLLPLLLLKLLVGGLIFLVVGPVLLVTGIIAGLALLAAVVTPLLPLVVIGLVVYLLVKAGGTSVATP